MAKALDIPPVKSREEKNILLPNISKDGLATPPLVSPLGTPLKTPLGTPCTPNKLQAAISRGSSISNAGSTCSTRSSVCSNCRTVCRVCSRTIEGGKKEGDGTAHKVQEETLAVGRAAIAGKNPQHSCKRCGYMESPLVHAKKVSEVRGKFLF